MTATSTINFSETGLVAGMLNEDQDFFSDIYDTYAASIYGLILKWVKEEQKAEIILHNTFVKAWHARKLFNAENENLFFWLCGMARICYHEKLK